MSIQICNIMIFFIVLKNEELHEQLSIKLCKYMYPHLLEAVKKAIAAKEIYIENPEALISFIIYGQVGLLSKSNIDHHEVAKLLNQYVNQLMNLIPDSRD